MIPDEVGRRRHVFHSETAPTNVIDVRRRLSLSRLAAEVPRPPHVQPPPQGTRFPPGPGGTVTK